MNIHVLIKNYIGTNLGVSVVVSASKFEAVLELTQLWVENEYIFPELTSMFQVLHSSRRNHAI